jgi:WD40 repeat protein
VAIRSVLPLSLTDLAEPYIITGAGDIIRIYDVSTLEEPDLIGQVDAHWHDVTALRLWVRKTVGDDDKTRVEPWIISTSLDGTIRKWKLQGMSGSHWLLEIKLTAIPSIDLLNPSPVATTSENKQPAFQLKDEGKFEMTEEEERELAELADSD